MSRPRTNPVTDGRHRGREICGIWMPEGKFCPEFVFSLRRCKRHYYAFRKDDIWRVLHSATKEQREISLNVLDSLQKRRPKWEYEPPGASEDHEKKYGEN